MKKTLLFYLTSFFSLVIVLMSQFAYGQTEAVSKLEEFDIYGIKLYMSEDEVISTLQKHDPKRRLRTAKIDCVADAIKREISRRTNQGYDNLLNCTDYIDFPDTFNPSIKVRLIEDLQKREGKSYVYRIEYSYKDASLASEKNKNILESQLFQKYGKPLFNEQCIGPGLCYLWIGRNNRYNGNLYIPNSWSVLKLGDFEHSMEGRIINSGFSLELWDEKYQEDAKKRNEKYIKEQLELRTPSIQPQF